MRLDFTKTKVEMVKKHLKRADIVNQGVKMGTLNSAMQENRISEETGQKIAQAIGVELSQIRKAE